MTTATDVNGLFAVDVFARKNGLRVCNPEAIRHVSGKLLQGEIIVMAVDPACMSPEEVAEITAAKGSKADFVEGCTGGTCCGCVDYKKGVKGIQ